MPGRAPSPLVQLAEASASASALVCFPWAGAGAARFHSWAEEAGSRVAVWAVRLPGRESRLGEAPHVDIRDAVGEVIDALSVQLKDVPLAFFGHCSGAVLAFECARELRRRRMPGPFRLIVAAQSSPRSVADAPPLELTHLRDRLARAGYTSPEVIHDDELFELVRPAIEADLGLVQHYAYAPSPPLRTPIDAFVGIGQGDLAARMAAWGDETAASFRLHRTEGDDYSSDADWTFLGRTVVALVAGAAA